MNSQNPILILQMQRMGDLALSFPLAAWLKGQDQERPVWLVGEKIFYEGLVDISPPLTYFSYSDSRALESHPYSLVINLSHRPEAAALSGRLKAEKRLGPHINEKGNLHVSGPWQLYRSSISHNNRHNLFHWADLNAMDCVPASSMLRTYWPPVKHFTGGAAPRIGLFVGASEPDKRPEPEFWASLAEKLLKKGFKPVFLGGKDDKPVAARAASILNAPAMNLSGHFSIIQLCRFIAELDLLIVPDTGPMHIAAWTGVPVLNLSIGPVNPWETGPCPPGHHVLRPSLSCTGCWLCTQKSVLCKKRLEADKVALSAKLILEESQERITRLPKSAGLLYRTRRDEFGLFDMELLNGHSQGRNSLAMFWKLFFSLELGFINSQTAHKAMLEQVEALRVSGLEPYLLAAGQKILVAVSRAIQGRMTDAFRSDDFWLSFPPAARPFASYVQFLLHNDDFSQASLAEALRLADAYINTLRG